MPPVLTFAQFQQAMRRGAVEPVYVLDGEEPYFHDEAIRLLEAAAMEGGGMALDLASFRGAEAALPEILDLASTYPMGGGRRLVVVREADGLRLESPKALAAYLARPNPRSCLVLSDVGFDRRRVLFRALAVAACRIDCRPLDEAATTQWVRERLRARGFGIGADLAEAVVAGLSGGGLGPLDAELQKLMIAIGEPRPVRPADLEILAGVPRLERSFEVAARALRDERGPAIGALRALLRAGEEPVYLLGGIASHVRNALKAAVASRRRLPVREAAALYNLEPWRFEKLSREHGDLEPRHLRAALGECLRADRELKGQGAKDPAHALELLVHRIGRARAGRPS